MPRYFFHIRHNRYQPDFQGEELSDRHVAWKEATVMAGKMLQDIDGRLQPEQDWEMEVTDEFANRLFRLVISAEKPR